MNLQSIVDFAAALFAAVLAVVMLWRSGRSAAAWFFGAGMAGLAAESALAGVTHLAEQMLPPLKLSYIVKAAAPALWLGFSLTYSRGNYREFLARWRFVLAVALVAPLALAAGLHDRLLTLVPTVAGPEIRLGTAGTALNVLFLLAAILILMNLEKTFRAAVGTMRWRIKFVVLALCAIFAARMYAGSQALLYNAVKPALADVEAGGLWIACVLIAISYLRAGRGEIDVYPSHAFLYNSITVVVSGIYLLVVGLLAQVAVAIGGSSGFPLGAFLLMTGSVGLGVLLLSDRVRQKTNRLISRHFKRPLYDYRKVWALVTERTASAANPAALCAATAKLISETFETLSVTLWLADNEETQLVFAGSTSQGAGQNPVLTASGVDTAVLRAALGQKPYPFDLDAAQGDWAEQLRRSNPGTFRTGGRRIAVPMMSNDKFLGVIVLADRVGGAPFSVEELDLLRSIGNHLGASLLGLQLSHQLQLAREQEAFRAVSAFFAHDLKNAASTLSLMLRNLPHHFEDPSFRADVLRGISKTVDHLNHLINRLSVLRQKPDIAPVNSDLVEVVGRSLEQWEDIAGIELVRDLQPVPRVLVDAEQLQKVVTNLVLNARDAVGQRGRICVQTSRRNGWAVLTISDNGCGMAQEFLRHSLFRPFQTTKKDGTGIGMFQCKVIVEAHRGKIEVESEPGKGTSFRILLPLPQPAS